MSKVTNRDIESLNKSVQTANQLSADLKAVASSESALLSDAATELLETVSQTAKKLERLFLAVQDEASCVVKQVAEIAPSSPSASDPDTQQVKIGVNDLEITSYYRRIGGQWAPITDNGITIKHLPTGISVSCDEMRSAHANRAEAMRRLYQILATIAPSKA